MSKMAKVTFVAIEDEDGIRDGSVGWKIYVDGVEVIDYISGSDMDLADSHLDPLWKAIGAELKFDYSLDVPASDYVKNIASTVLLK